MSDEERARLERVNRERLQEDYTELTVGQRIEQQAALSATLAEFGAAFSQRK